ncbi:ankyrin repeat and SOCS box protein 6-like [Sardina pilchardus]|uniref:ankyrin repeat and SOCS box protein 6-like n=1 Tax=Sardina pilchardus TaxID=27697 RepID=UPI002E12BA41
MSGTEEHGSENMLRLEPLPPLQYREVYDHHGPFSHIVYDPALVDAVLCAVGLQGEGGVDADRLSAGQGACESLEEVLEREAQSAVFVESISCALFKVAERGLVGAAEVLLRHGADPNFEDPVSYYNPLHIAVLRNRPLMVGMLVQHGADIDKRDRIFESSPLDLACEDADRLPCLRTLLALGADVNAHDKNGKPALIHALFSSDGTGVAVTPKYGNTENIRLLLEGGASVHVRTIDEETVMLALVAFVEIVLHWEGEEDEEDEEDEEEKEDAEQIGQFCLRVTELFLDHGEEQEDGEETHPSRHPSLTQTCLEHFDRLFPLALLLLQKGVALQCSLHGATCWSWRQLLLGRLEAALQESASAEETTDLLPRAETLLELAEVCCPSHTHTSASPLQSPHTRPQAPPHAAVLELRARLLEQETRPPPLRLLCRRLVRHILLPGPLGPKVQQLPLPDRLKDFLLPESSVQCRPGWDRFRPIHGPR